MGWPDDTEDMKRYFPTDTLVTGYDIIFFWVSRMIFQSLEFTKERPFKDVLLHGLIRDSQGRKMSKSLGNGIDPMDVIDKYGADALRWFLSIGGTPGQDLKFSYDKMDSAWNFINKIWNASRYVIMNLDGIDKPQLPDQSEWQLSDKWILSRLNSTINRVSELFEKYNFGEADRYLYDFIWNDFCDWYIEMSKEALNSDDEKLKKNTQNILAYVLDQTLRLLQPIMPFVTEYIWQMMPHEGKSLVTAAYPVDHKEFDDPTSEHQMQSLIDLITAVRNIRNEANAPLSSPIDMLIQTDNDTLKDIFESNREYIDRFCHTQELKIGKDIEAPKLSMSAVITDATIYVPLAELVDLKDEQARVQKDVDKFESEVARSDKKLANKRFVDNAPEAVVEEEKTKQADYQSKLDAAKERLQQISSEM